MASCRRSLVSRTGIEGLPLLVNPSVVDGVIGQFAVLQGQHVLQHFDGQMFFGQPEHRVGSRMRLAKKR